LSLFITFEGPEGGGKSTQARLLAAWLEETGHSVLLTREPGGTRIGDQIRRIIVDQRNQELTSEAEILLFNASRAQLVREVIRPALESGTIVICDRYADSTMAYQGYGRRLDLERLRTIVTFATGDLTPDLTLLLDIPPAVGLARRRAAAASGAEWNRLDAETLSFHERVRQGYLALVAAEPQRWAIIPATGAPETIAEAVRSAVRPLLARASTGQ
jgi:dTMP kinase